MALVGARGASEFISRSIYTNDTNGGNLFKWHLDTSSKYRTIYFCYNINSINTGDGFMRIGADSLYIKFSSTSEIQIFGENLSGGIALDCKITTYTTSQWCHLFVSFDMNDTNKRFAGLQDFSGNAPGFERPDLIAWLTYNNEAIGTGNTEALNICNSNGNEIDGSISSFYYSDLYIDFSQESNRNLFVNQLGYPRDLTPEIEAGNIPQPLIYLPFDDTSNLGKNLGTGGDFTVNGTVTAGADFTL